MGTDRMALFDVADETVQMRLDSVILEGSLTIPRGATGGVLFAHGSGSSRRSPRNRYVANVLASAGFATLLMDLLTQDEERAEAVTRHLRFDIERLAERLVGATDWLLERDETRSLALGYFGASTGTGAALVAAARRPKQIGAIVSRGGRPDLGGTALSHVWAPTLLIVGGQDRDVMRLNQIALDQLPGERQLAIVPGATHLFEEPGALEQVARFASWWFTRHLGLRGVPETEA